MFWIRYAASSLPLLMYVALTAILIRRYWQTRDIGFVWLSAALIIWPLLSSVADRGEVAMLGRMYPQNSNGVFSVPFLEGGQLTIGDFLFWTLLLNRLVGVSLLLIAVFCLSRPRRLAESPAAR
jgi:hypothetical protein